MAITHGRAPFRAVKTLSGMSIPAHNFPEAATQTFKAGAPVTLTAGYIAETGTDGAKILGIASRDGQNAPVGVRNQVVILAHPDTVFLGNLSDAAGTLVSAATHRGAAIGMAKDVPSGKWYLDAGEATVKQAVIIDFWDGVINGQQAAIGDTLHPVYFVFTAAAYQLLTP
jgi:hypothetical protein